MIARCHSQKGTSLTNIAVIGSGYVGLVQSACLADASYNVVTCDIDEEKIRSLNEGNLPFYEPGLKEMIKKNLSLKRLYFTSKLEDALKETSICFICVSTPPNDDGSSDLTSLFSVCDSIASIATKKMIVVIKSTVPPGTAHTISNRLTEKNPSLNFDVLSNPEFLQEGLAIKNCMTPDRVIIGHANPDSACDLGRIYESFPIKNEKILYMDLESAEMTKYAANTMLANRLSMINEISRLCEKAGANIDCVKDGLVLDPRIGKNYLNPGIGFGGSCLPKDISALVAFAKKNEIDVHMLKAVNDTNSSLIGHFVNKITSHFKTKDLSHLTFCIWGVAFKSGTDDVRKSPALEIVKSLLDLGAKVRIYDPLAMDNVKSEITKLKIAQGEIKTERITWGKNALDCANDCDALCLLTGHYEFSSVNLNELKSSMKSPLVFDGRNFLSKEQLIMLKFTYFGMGR